MHITVIMIVRNQIEEMKRGMRAIRAFGGIADRDIIIVDNASEDGLQEWLKQHTDRDYLICDGGEESYATILNAVIREFAIKTDVLVLGPGYMLLPGTLERMSQALHSRGNIGAVSGRILGDEETCGMDYAAAAEYMMNQKSMEDMIQTMQLQTEAILIRGELLRELGEFDEDMTSPFSGMVDYVFRGIKSGWQFYECKDACIFPAMEARKDYYTKYAADIPMLQQKWHMNYFGIFPNKYLLSCVKEEKREIHVLEIGCDCGANLLEVKKRCPNAKLYGVELNEASAEIASHFIMYP